MEALCQLTGQRLAEARRETTPFLEKVFVSIGIGTSPHFSTARGFATTTVYNQQTFYIKVADRLLQQPRHRQDAIVRHEIGHIVDFAVTPLALDAWAVERNFHLPQTRERRADTIAQILWGQPIYYDEELVQTLENGTTPRPEALGL